MDSDTRFNLKRSNVLFDSDFEGERLGSFCYGSLVSTVLVRLSMRVCSHRSFLELRCGDAECRDT